MFQTWNLILWRREMVSRKWQQFPVRPATFKHQHPVFVRPTFSPCPVPRGWEDGQLMMMAMMRTEFSDDILLSAMLICIVRTCARTHTHRSGNFRRFPSCINISGFAFFIIVCFLALSVCLLGYIFVCFVDLSFWLSIYVCERGKIIALWKMCWRACKAWWTF